ncbi:MAG: hypothetical protein PHR35_03395 [Kiritimatiellae bacterium]|nr:hypothetical protein [Kiritimatiellia bacterium]
MEYRDYLAAIGRTDGYAVEAQPDEGQRETLPIDVLGKMVAGLLSLSPMMLEVVLRRYQGQSYRQIASSRGVTASAIETRHWRALQRWPALQAMFGLKRTLGRRRKKRGADATRTAGGAFGAGGKGGNRRKRGENEGAGAAGNKEVTGGGQRDSRAI